MPTPEHLTFKNKIQPLVWSHHFIELIFVIFVSFWPIVRIGSIIPKSRCFSPVPRFNHDTGAGTIWVWISALVLTAEKFFRIFSSFRSVWMFLFFVREMVFYRHVQLFPKLWNLETGIQSFKGLYHHVVWYFHFFKTFDPSLYHIITLVNLIIHCWSLFGRAQASCQPRWPPYN